MQNLSPQATKQKMDSESANVCFFDVRSQNEFQSGHIPGSVCLPLDQIEAGKADIPKDKLVILSCQSGMRSAKAFRLLQERGFKNIVLMEGGFSAWSAAGFPVNRTRNTLPLIRQVMLTSGSLVLVGSLLSLTVNPQFAFLPLFIGGGLAIAGATGWCGMAMLLEKMPWNRA